MDLTFVKVKIHVVVGEHAGKFFGDAFGFKDDFVFCHVISRRARRLPRAVWCDR